MRGGLLLLLLAGVVVGVAVLCGLATALGVAAATGAEVLASLSGSACAEALPYGPGAVYSQASLGWLSTAVADKEHSRWRTETASVGNIVDLRVEWEFLNGTKTVRQRFADAVAWVRGEPVRWEVYTGANVWGTVPDATVNGSWRFSKNAGVTEATFDTTGSSFSADDGCFGAPQHNGSTVDCDVGGTVPYWGVGNFDSSDALQCSKTYLGPSGTTTSADVETYVFVYHADTPAPATAPSMSPSISLAPSSSAPTLAPLLSLPPTPAESPAPTFPVTIIDGTHFARLTGTQCAEALPYGPGSVASALPGAYLSTDPSDVMTDYWTMVIDKEGDSTPDMRIVWHFTGPLRSLSNRFAVAVATGEAITWQVFYGSNVYGSTPDLTRSGTWRFSSNSQIIAATFAGSGTGFSFDDGCWGPPTTDAGTVDGDNGGSVQHGLQNYNSQDGSTCLQYIVNGVVGSASASLTADLYFGDLNLQPTSAPSTMVPSISSAPTVSPQPSVSPTISLAPTVSPAPTLQPTDAPSRAPTFAPTETPPVLLVETTGTACAESLSYGSAAVEAVTGAWLTTSQHNALHTVWEQEIYATGVGNGLDMRIIWTFSTSKSVRHRFRDAVSIGELVTWDVFHGANVDGTVPDVTLVGTWRFSSTSGITGNKFYGSGTAFSADDGLWGGLDGGSVDGNVVDCAYGVGNYNAGDVSATIGCGGYRVASVVESDSTALISRVYVRKTADATTDDLTGDDTYTDDTYYYDDYDDFSAAPALRALSSCRALAVFSSIVALLAGHCYLSVF